MRYLEGKNWQYHVKSAAVTFLAVFIPLFMTAISAFDLNALEPASITVNAVTAAAVAVVRVALVSAAQAVVILAKKYQR